MIASCVCMNRNEFFEIFKRGRRASHSCLSFMKVFSYSAILTGGLAASVSACDICAIYSASEARGEVGKGAFAGLSEQFTHFGTVQVDGKKIEDPSGQYLNSSISQVFVGYNFT